MKPSGLGMQLSGRVRAQHAEGQGLSSALHKGKTGNLQNKKLRPNTISFRTQNKTSYQSVKLEMSTFSEKRPYSPVCKTASEGNTVSTSFLS